MPLKHRVHSRLWVYLDFLVGDEAFETTSPIAVYRKELAEIARVGVIDLMGVPSEYGELQCCLTVPGDDEIPVIPAPALVLLKLSAGRPQDIADVHALLQAGLDAFGVRDYLDRHAPQLVSALAKIVG